MKHSVLGLVVFVCSAVATPAELLLNDSFRYPDGDLVTSSTNLWSHHSGSVTGEVMVASGRILLDEVYTEDVHALLAGQPYPADGPTNVFYASFKVKFAALPGSRGAYFAHFKDSGNGFRARVWALRSGAAPGKFRLGISSSSGGSTASVTYPMDLSLNTDYTIVTRLLNSNSTSTLWINPAAETDASVSTSDGFSTFTVVSYAFRESSGEGVLNVDNLKIGTAFGEVAGGSDAASPAIVSGPRHQTVTNGADVTFSVTATGTPPLTYQWQLNRTNLPGAVCSNLTLPEVSFAQAGFYTVSITNEAGSTVSDPAALSVWSDHPPGFSYLTYNVHGNGLTNWSTNLWHVQAIGRQMEYLDPDIITFNEIPVTNQCTAQMADFVVAFCPGYYLATNSLGDGYIRNVILSRFPVIASRSWLHGVSLAPFGYTNANPAPYFTRDLFEAEISMPHWPQPLHVFTVHLKAGQDAGSAAKRGAEAAAVSNFFATVYLPAHPAQPYVLSGDMNEDVLYPPVIHPQSLPRLISRPTGLRMTTPVNPVTDSELTWSIQDAGAGPTVRYDYILPCATLFSNMVSSQVFRTDRLTPLPSNLYSNDDRIASDHLPVMMVFANPFDTSFRVLSVAMTNRTVSLTWESQSNRSYQVEVSSNLTAWTPWATPQVATGTCTTFTVDASNEAGFFRVYRVP